MSRNTEFIGDKIYGTWLLRKFVYKDHSGREEKYFGQKPEGILIYGKSGYMSVNIFQEGRPFFDTTNFDGGSEQDKVKAFSTCFSYYGSFDEEAPGKFVHAIKGSLFPNWAGQKTIRYGKIEGNLLFLTTPPIASEEGENVFEIVWEKVPERK